MTLCMKIYISALVIIFGVMLFIFAKINRTGELISMLNDAIFEWNIYQIDHHDYSTNTSAPTMSFLYDRDGKVFDKTLWRLWDWGYEHILPSEDLEKIRPFIKER